MSLTKRALRVKHLKMLQQHRELIRLRTVAKIAHERAKVAISHEEVDFYRSLWSKEMHKAKAAKAQLKADCKAVRLLLVA